MAIDSEPKIRIFSKLPALDDEEAVRNFKKRVGQAMFGLSKSDKAKITNFSKEGALTEETGFTPEKMVYVKDILRVIDPKVEFKDDVVSVDESVTIFSDLDSEEDPEDVDSGNNLFVDDEPVGGLDVPTRSSATPTVSTGRGRGVKPKPSGSGGVPKTAVDPVSPKMPSAIDTVDAATVKKEDYESFDAATVEEMKTKSQEMKEAYKALAAEVGKDENKGKPTHVLQGEDLRAYRGYVNVLGKFAQRVERISNQGDHLDGGFNATRREIEQVTNAYTTIQERAKLVEKILVDHKGKEVKVVDPEIDPDKEKEYEKRLVIRADWKVKKQMYEEALVKFEATPKDKAVLAELKDAEETYRKARGIYSKSLEYAFKERVVKRRGVEVTDVEKEEAIEESGMKSELGSLLAERFVLEPVQQRLAAEKASLTNQERGTFENLFEKVRDGVEKHRGKIKVAGYGVLTGVALTGGVAGIVGYLLTKKVVALSVTLGASAGGAGAGFAYQKFFANQTEKKLGRAVDALEKNYNTQTLDDLEKDYYENAKKYATADRNKKRAVIGVAAVGALIGLAVSAEAAECADALEEVIENLTDDLPVAAVEETAATVSKEVESVAKIVEEATAVATEEVESVAEIAEEAVGTPVADSAENYAEQAPSTVVAETLPSIEAAPEQLVVIPEEYGGTDTLSETLYENFKAGNLKGVEDMSRTEFLNQMNTSIETLRGNEKILELMSVEGHPPLKNLDLVYKGAAYDVQPLIDHMKGMSLEQIESGLRDVSGQVAPAAEAVAQADIDAALEDLQSKDTIATEESENMAFKKDEAITSVSQEGTPVAVAGAVAQAEQATTVVTESASGTEDVAISAETLTTTQITEQLTQGFESTVAARTFAEQAGVTGIDKLFYANGQLYIEGVNLSGYEAFYPELEKLEGKVTGFSLSGKDLVVLDGKDFSNLTELGLPADGNTTSGSTHIEFRKNGEILVGEKELLGSIVEKTFQSTKVAPTIFNNLN